MEYNEVLTYQSYCFGMWIGLRALSLTLLTFIFLRTIMSLKFSDYNSALFHNRKDIHFLVRCMIAMFGISWIYNSEMNSGTAVYEFVLNVVVLWYSWYLGYIEYLKKMFHDLPIETDATWKHETSYEYTYGTSPFEGKEYGILALKNDSNQDVVMVVCALTHVNFKVKRSVHVWHYQRYKNKIESKFVYGSVSHSSKENRQGDGLIFNEPITLLKGTTLEIRWDVLPFFMKYKEEDDPWIDDAYEYMHADPQLTVYYPMIGNSKSYILKTNKSSLLNRLERSIS